MNKVDKVHEINQLQSVNQPHESEVLISINVHFSETKRNKNVQTSFFRSQLILLPQRPAK